MPDNDFTPALEQFYADRAKRAKSIVTKEQLMEWLIDHGTLEDEGEFSDWLLEDFVILRRPT